eukprot:150345_1
MRHTATTMLLIQICIPWFLLISNGKAYTVNCSITDCQTSWINCPPRENCFVSCDDEQSCIGSVINCPVNGDCSIECHGSQSCQDVFIDATLLSGDLNVLCKGDSNSTDHCKGMQIYGNTLQSNHGTFTVECSGHLRSCMHAELSCPLNGECNLDCTGHSSCQYAVVTGPIHNNLHIDCDAERACFGATFNGAVSSQLSVTGCTKLKSCLDLTLYCPPHNNNGVKQCFIEGNDNLGSDASSVLPTAFPTQSPTLNPTIDTNVPTPVSSNSNGIVIYAVNGFDDIAINYTGTFGATHEGMMICGSDYDSVCNLAARDWSCQDSNIYCHDRTHTYTPSVAPTVDQIRIHSAEPTARGNHHGTTKMAYVGAVIHDVGDGDGMQGDVFILSGVCVMIVTCLCVGCAKFRKSIAEAHQAKHQRQSGTSVPSSVEYNSRHSLSRKQSISRSHPSISRRSIYDEVDPA